MGQLTDARIQDFQTRTGIRPATGPRAERLERLSQLAFELIKAIELERNGIRDGDGQWHGTDVIGSIVREITDAERADLKAWKDQRDSVGPTTQTIRCKTRPGATMTEMFRLSSVIDNWPHQGYRYDGVDVRWFKKRNDLPLSALFADADNDGYRDSLAEECFTAVQADALEAYLTRVHGDALIREAVTLPLEDGYIGVGAIPVGGNCDFHILSSEPDYDLLFAVWGYYRVHGAESYITIGPDGVGYVTIPGPGARRDERDHARGQRDSVGADLEASRDQRHSIGHNDPDDLIPDLAENDDGLVF